MDARINERDERMKKVGILYDNISGNIGDQAIGISLRKMLRKIGVEFEELVPGRFHPKDYQTIIIGGGYLLQPSPNFFYDKFRVAGPHILNACGIVGFPDDLQYLNDYLYVSVRSSGDKHKLYYLTKEVKVVPCTTMLLDDLVEIDLRIHKPSVGVQLWDGIIDEELLAQFLSTQPYHVYFLPITHYNHDFKYLGRLSQKVKNATLLPILTPEEVFTIIGKLNYLITASLHGAIFAYVHNVPFALCGGQDKLVFFMQDRNLDAYLFNNFDELKSTFEVLQNNPPDYSESLERDLKTLKEHQGIIKDNLYKNYFMPAMQIETGVFEDAYHDVLAKLQQRNFQIHYLQKQVEALDVQAKSLGFRLKEKEAQVKSLEENLAQLRNQLAQREQEHAAEKERLCSRITENERTIAQLEETLNQLRKQLVEKDTEILLIRSSLGWFLIARYRRFADKLFPSGTRRRIIFELSQKALKVLITAGPIVLVKKIKNWLVFARHKKAKNHGFSERKGEQTLLTDDFTPFALPEVSHPKASIIIPVFNKWLYTYNCLRSIAQNTEGVPYEVIVVDNASQDETRTWLDRIERVRVIRNSKNDGFVTGCNRGSQAARGEYLVFLNNDVVVKPGWLSELIRTFESDASIGLVGAKLLYPDGSLQEAGGIIWNDGTGWNYGRGDQSNKPEYNFLREVDYCSGACLAVKREVFEALGGFDVRYQPAYYEDSDLCFAARNLGLKVVYQPKVEVIHFEGVTAGRDESQGVKAFQAINRPKFVDKWREVLQQHHWPPEASLVWRARRWGKKPEVLIVDHYVPEWDKDSGSFRMRQIIELFNELGWNITFYPDNLSRLEPYTSDLQQLGVEVIYGATTFELFIKERANQFDLIILCRPDVSFNKIDIIRHFSPKTKIVYDTVDLHFIREARRAAVEHSEDARLSAERYKAIEIYLAKTADMTLVVTKEEQQRLLEIDSALNVSVIPNIHPTPEQEFRDFETRSGVLFLGSYMHPPNVDGVKWFVVEIWPLIRRELQDVEFYVIGSNVPEEIKRLKKITGVRVVGWVPDVAPWFDKCRIFVSPLRYGAGMKGKIGHAMSYGLPVVTTTIGAEGMDLIDGETAVIRDDPEEFAKAVVELYRSRILWKKLSRKSIEHIEANYSPRAVLSKLNSVLQRLGLPTNVSLLEGISEVKVRHIQVGQAK